MRRLPRAPACTSSSRRRWSAPPTPSRSSSATRALTYRELDARANRLARAAACAGRGPGRAWSASTCERSLEMVVGLLGILKAGGAYVPLDPGLPAPSALALMLRGQRARRCCSPRAAARRAARATTRSVLALDAAPRSRAHAPRARAARRRRENLAYVIFTSGSTGRPKGVMVEHRNVANFFTGMDQRARPRAARRVAGGDQHLLRHLGARAVLDAGPRLQGGHPGGGRRARAVAASSAAGPERRWASASSTSPPTPARARATTLPAAAGGREVRRRARLRGGVDARAPLPRLRRPVPEPGA